MTEGRPNVYQSFDEFQKAFYPKFTKIEQERETESFGRELARYAVEKHFTSTKEVEETQARKPARE